MYTRIQKTVKEASLIYKNNIDHKIAFYSKNRVSSNLRGCSFRSVTKLYKSNSSGPSEELNFPPNQHFSIQIFPGTEMSEEKGWSRC